VSPSVEMASNPTQLPNQSVQDTSGAHVAASVQQQPQTASNMNSANSMDAISPLLMLTDKSVVIADCFTIQIMDPERERNRHNNLWYKGG